MSDRFGTSDWSFRDALVVTLVNALKEQNKTLGIASICHGSGGGTAIALERL